MIDTLLSLQKKYMDLADGHGFQSILGNKRFRDYHASLSSKYNQLFIKVSEKILNYYERK